MRNFNWMMKSLFRIGIVFIVMGTCSGIGIAVADENDTKTATESTDVKEEEQKTPKAIDLGQVTVTGKIADDSTENIPAVVESITAEGIERINAVETSDVFKYMPGSYLRKLYPGGTNSPLVIRGNNSTMTGRTLVLMDGIRISDFTAAGNSNAPKWFVVAPQEIEMVDVIYGPFSAAFSGNSMSGTAMITTHMPEKLEVQADANYFYQNFHEYHTDEDLNGYNAFASAGNKTGRWSYNFWYNRLDTENQSVSYVTKEAASGGAASGNSVTGWDADKDPENKDRYILGSGGVSEIVNNTFKVKLDYDLGDDAQLRFTSVLWDSELDEDSPESYLRDAAGNTVYAGTVDIDGRSFNLSDSTFRYRKSDRQDFLNGLSFFKNSPDGWTVEAVLSTYQTLDNVTRQSSTAPPDAKSGGAGKITDGDEGWYTADLKVAHDIEWQGSHTLGGGYHFDQYFTDSETWNASNWLKDERTTLNQGAEGKTRTQALFIEDTWHFTDQWSVYLGGRYEWWRGFDASKSIDTTGGRVETALDDKDETNFSPKFSTTFRPNDVWRLRFSLATATRYPTVGELYYGGITATGIIPNANPDLKPEESFAKDFTITRFLGEQGEARLTFFEDSIENAIYSQTNSYTLVKNFQNVDEVRTRGVEFAFNMRRFLVDGLGLFANVAWTNSKILRNDNVPESVGKDFPRVPEWRVKGVLDYSPSDRWALTVAGHYASKQYGNLDNSDTEGGYGGIDDFLVFDAKFTYHFTPHWQASVGVDNITDELYHVSHPYPMRTYLAELKYTF